ncbi:type II CRISPR RNA-guided endonuclease Cas9 [Treponema pectinovorum]|uniref:type II CRISPR RNA-guided endonuclease Cas9 n=1 Tax=Treponema pectinovorum TaxID=164 RepID=UPI0011F3AFFE|nr:type II CRISPR RNA-guided endonuclease Cas9 [Treponema pectinovorum]
MNWRLGLDLGTNSIGWSVISLDSEKNVNSLIDLGVRIFSDGRNQKTKEPLAVARRIARGARKSIHRRKIRRRKTFKLLQKEGLFPLSKEEAQALKLKNPYELRIDALERKLEPFELGRVLFNLSVRRGFKSNRKDNNQEETKDTVSANKTKYSQTEMCSNLENAVKNSGYRTLGEFLWKMQEENHGIRFAPNRNVFYPTRKLYEQEFSLIKEKQSEFYPNVDWDAIYQEIFYQRPLKAQPRGKCQFMRDKDRTYKALPCSQKIRILQEVRNLKYIDESKKTCPISEEGEAIIIGLLNTKKDVTFDAMRKALKLSSECTFNLEENRESLKGNSTAVIMRSKNRFGEMWDKLTLEEQDQIVETMITADEDFQVFEVLKKYELSDEQKSLIVKTVLPSGTTMLCKEVTQALVKKMESIGSGCDLVTAEKMLGFKHADQSVTKTDLLEYYGKILVGSTVGGDLSAPEDKPENKYGKISNPTVHVALNQTRTVVNALIKQYGKPEQISVELSRDLKASREAKRKTEQKQNQRRKENVLLNDDLIKKWKISYPNRNDRLKYRLWKELDNTGHKCIYCGKEFDENELFTNNIQIEHILPYSRTLLDAESNLTLAHASCNKDKGERSPFEAFGANPKGYNWAEIKYRSEMLKEASKRNKFAVDAMEAFEKDSGFIARQLTDNAYLSKIAYKYLHSICDNVWTVNGGMTKLLRDKWDIDSVLARKFDEDTVVKLGLTSEQIGEYKKNRRDHRHHAMDAVLIALTDRSLVKEISTMNARSMKNRIEVPPFPIYRQDFIDKVKNIVISFKPDHGFQGKLSKETLLGKIKREEKIDIKNLNENDIQFIKTERVKTEISKCYEETKDIKEVRKQFKDIYPQIIVFKEFFVSRKNLANFNSDKDLENIVDAKIKERIRAFVENHSEMKFEQAILEYSKQTGTKKVRCINHGQTPIEINNSAVPRYLDPEDFFAAVVWKIPPKKEGGKETFKAKYIRRDQVGKDNKIKEDVLKSPEPAAKNIAIVYKDDYLEFLFEGKWYKCRIAGYSTTDNKFDIRPIYTATDCYDWLYSTNEAMIENCWNPKKGQNHVSVNVLFGERQAHSITVNPIGRVFRK